MNWSACHISSPYRAALALNESFVHHCGKAFVKLPHNDANHKLAFQDGAACLCVRAYECAQAYKPDRENLSNLLLIFITSSLIFRVSKRDIRVTSYIFLMRATFLQPHNQSRYFLWANVSHINSMKYSFFQALLNVIFAQADAGRRGCTADYERSWTQDWPLCLNARLLPSSLSFPFLPPLLHSLSLFSVFVTATQMSMHTAGTGKINTKHRHVNANSTWWWYYIQASIHCMRVAVVCFIAHRRQYDSSVGFLM